MILPPPEVAPPEAARRREYDRWVGRATPSAMALRWAMSRTGAFFVNGPVYRLPEELRLRPDLRLLDIGCGRGAALSLLDERVRFTRPPVGLDFSRAALRLAAGDRPARAGGAALVQASAAALPFADRSFNVVISSYVMKHLDDAELLDFLEEVYRVLAEGGLALLWDFAPTGSGALDGWNRFLLSRGIREPRLRSTRTLLDAAAEAGFEFRRPARLRPFLLPPIPRASIFVGRAPAGWQAGRPTSGG